MQRLNLLLDVWREVCRHLEIGESAERLAPILGRRLPVQFFLVRHFDLQRSCLEPVATGCCASQPMTLRPRTDCPGHSLEDLLNWCRREEVIRASAQSAARKLP